MITRLPAAAAAAATTLLLAASAACAAPTVTPQAPVGGDAPLSAYGGWVVWSEPDAEGKWSLWTWHDGVRARIAVMRRTVPFDADAGPDEQGRPTVTFSRCAVEPSPDAPQPWSTAKRCRPRAVTLADGRERAIHVGHRPAGASDSTPSLWRGRVVFQRRTPGSDVSQLMAYDFTTHRLRTLRHGAVPHRCDVAGGCAKAKYMGEAGEIDLGAKAVAFSWHLATPGVTGVAAAWEMRAERLSDLRSILVGNGYVSGACGARTPYSPNATAAGVVFLSRWYHCEQVEGTVTSGAFASGGLLSRTDDVGGGVAWRIARDAATGATYALLGPAHRSTQTPLPAGSLTLVQVAGLTLAPTGKHAGEPFIT